MSKTLTRLLTLFSACLLATSLQAASVWKVSKGDQQVYIGGTVHLLSAQDYPLPDEYKKAYDASQTVVFETDMAAISSPQFQQMSMMKMTYRDGTTIKDVLNKQTLEALEAHLKARNIPMQNLLPFKPSLLYVTLSVIELQTIGLNVQGVDQYYSTLAMGDNKTQGWLETPEEQLNFLASLDKGDPNRLLGYTLRDLKKLPSIMEDLKGSWRTGDMEKMAEIGIKPFKQDYPQIYQDLIVTRNNNWVPQIESFMATEEVEFILVGALHLAGEDSVLKQLKEKGFTVEKL